MVQEMVMKMFSDCSYYGFCAQGLECPCRKTADAIIRIVMEEAARVADAYAEENFAMATDSIMLDPILAKGRAKILKYGTTEDDARLSAECEINGTIHSSMGHAARHIAEAIRSVLKEPASK